MFALQNEGFTSSMIDRFFRPFMGGIFFDRKLGTSSRLFEFVMRMLATGDNCLPSGGIGTLAENLSNQLPPGTIKTGGIFAGAVLGCHLEAGYVLWCKIPKNLMP